MTGCLIFDNKSFSSIGGGPIIDGITSSVFWNAGNPEGTQAIVFQSNRTAVSSICYPSLVTTPMAAPVTNSPLAAPVADSPITPPYDRWQHIHCLCFNRDNCVHCGCHHRACILYRVKVKEGERLYFVLVQMHSRCTPSCWAPTIKPRHISTPLTFIDVCFLS